jgi:hypothetical protein
MYSAVHCDPCAGVRPYKCNLCEKSFTQRCSLESHCLKVHGVAHQYDYKQRRSKVSTPLISTLWSALQRQNTEISKHIFPEKEYRGLGPNFHIHVSVIDIYIYSHDRSAYSAGGNMWTAPGTI